MADTRQTRVQKCVQLHVQAHVQTQVQTLVQTNVQTHVQTHVKTHVQTWHTHGRNTHVSLMGQSLLYIFHLLLRSKCQTNKLLVYHDNTNKKISPQNLRNNI